MAVVGEDGEEFEPLEEAYVYCVLDDMVMACCVCAKVCCVLWLRSVYVYGVDMRI